MENIEQFAEVKTMLSDMRALESALDGRDPLKVLLCRLGGWCPLLVG